MPGTPKPKDSVKRRVPRKRVRNRHKKMAREEPQRTKVVSDRDEWFEKHGALNTEVRRMDRVHEREGERNPQGLIPKGSDEMETHPTYLFIGDSPVEEKEEPAKPSGFPVPRVDVSHEKGRMFPPRHARTKRVEIPEHQKREEED